MTPLPSRRTAVPSLLAIVLLAGCAGTPTKTAADGTEYEYVTPLGSNIPVKVPKGQKSAANATSPTATMSADELGAMVNSSAKAPARGGP
ncbi:MAG: hypothetical protein HZC55_21795 [Verrucomicrobia bacterium]|nr:hypothetical protein [Verrucomicrobiota bacterium]